MYDLLVVVALLIHIQRLKTLGLYDLSVSSSDKTTTTTKSDEKLGPLLSFLSNKLGEKSKITQFLKRVVWTPKPFTTSSKRISVLKKIGKNYFALVFVLKLFLFVFTLLYYTDMKDANDTVASASTSTFSTGTIKAVVLLLGDIIVDSFAFQTETMHLKFLLHVVEVVVVHCFVFFETSHLPFATNSTLIVFYLIWIVVHIMTTLQIQNGFHTLQRMTLYTRHNYETLDKLLFIVYRAIPFVNELDVILRWVTSETAMDLAMHFRLNDILSTLFRAKCESVRRVTDGRFLSGKNRTDIIERFVSAIWFGIIILVLILPILFFSSVNPLTASNEVTRATARVSISTDREVGATLFELYSAENAFSIRSVTASEFATLRSRVTLPSAFSDRTQEVKFPSSSSSLWSATPPAKNTLTRILNSTDSQATYFRLDLSFYHASGAQEDAVFFSSALSTSDRIVLQHQIQGTQNLSDYVSMLNTYPSVLELGSGTATPTTAYSNSIQGAKIKLLRDTNESNTIWWDALCSSSDELQCSNDEGIAVYVVWSEIATGLAASLQSAFNASSVITFYATVVLLVSG